MKTNQYALFIVPSEVFNELRKSNYSKLTIVLGTYPQEKGKYKELLLWGYKADRLDKIRQYQVFDDCVIDVLNKIGLQITIPRRLKGGDPE